MKIIFKLGYTEEDQLPRKSQYRTKQMIQLLEYLKSIPGEHLDKRCYRELSGGQQQRVLFPISVCMVCIDRRNTCYWIAFATASIFGKVIVMWSYEKIYKTHGGNLPDDIYIYRMWKSYDIEENIKKGNRLWSGKDEVYATVYQIDGDNNKYCRLANAVIK